jgi:hypothetical protein
MMDLNTPDKQVARPKIAKKDPTRPTNQQIFLLEDLTIGHHSLSKPDGWKQEHSLNMMPVGGLAHQMGTLREL